MLNVLKLFVVSLVEGKTLNVKNWAKHANNLILVVCVGN